MGSNTARYRIAVTVDAQYIAEQSAPDQSDYVFAFTICIINEGTVASQLISRHWIIEDGNGQVSEVKGLGVVGHQPLLQPGEKFEYSSGSQLPTATGEMHGSYLFVAEDGERFDAQIPAFVLNAPRTLH